MTKGPDVMCFRVGQTVPQGDGKTAYLAMVMMA